LLPGLLPGNHFISREGYAEAYCVANDLEQAQGRVFAACKRIVECSPLLRSQAKVLSDRIEFPVTGATITAIASDYAGAAGANPVISTFDELWGYVSERSRRLCACFSGRSIASWTTLLL